MPYPFIEYIKIKLHEFKYYLGFRTPQEQWLDGYNYAIMEILSSNKLICCYYYDRTEFDKGVDQALRDIAALEKSNTILL